MSIEKTPYGNYINDQNFREAQNLADQGISKQEDLERFLQICQTLESYQLREILFHCRDPNACIELLNNNKDMVHCFYLTTAISCAKKKGFTEKYESLKEYVKKNNLLPNPVKIKPLQLVTYNNINKTACDFIEKNQKNIESIIRSSYWHDYKSKYPMNVFNIHLMYTNLSKGLFSLVLTLNNTFRGPNSIYLPAMIDSEIDYDDLINTNIIVYEIARYVNQKWKGSLGNIIHYNQIKCNTCNNIINDTEIPPQDKLISKTIPGNEEKCFKCRKETGEEINYDEYYSDWGPYSNLKWIIPGSSLIIDSDDSVIKEEIKKIQIPRQFGSFKILY